MDILKDKVAIVNGAGSGIGMAIALFYAAEGAKLVISDIAVKAGNETVAEIRANGGESIFVKADMDTGYGITCRSLSLSKLPSFTP